ncbi:MAG: DUF72 domain-containing protein [Nitrososphaerales archaeon]
MEQSVLVGVGGWAYLPIRHTNKLQACSKLYDFVELNSTYYKLPMIESVIKWRKLVPDEFEFTVRANGKLTHENYMKPIEENFRIYQKMLEICRALGARILHFQFPPSFKVTSEVIKDWREFFISADKLGKWNAGLSHAFEIRNSDSDTTALERFYDDFDIIPTGDATKSGNIRTSANSKILYTRVFGLGDHTRWSFDSEEIESLKKKVEKSPAKRRYVTFHNMTMYEDASRMKSSVLGNEIDALHRNFEFGGDSLQRVLLLSRIKFPATRAELESQFGWKTFDAGSGKRVHVGKHLAALPDNKEFNSVEEITQSLSRTGKTV